ncbi:MAG: redoxin domain-containing protein [Planctomycetales bacterium]|nr:redoxin domain-containing protein [Planctomycetales bacterium]
MGLVSNKVGRFIATIAGLVALFALRPASVGPVAADDKAANESSPRATSRLTGTDLDGRFHRLGENPRSPAIVVVFLATECPISNEAVPGLNRMAAAYAKRQVQFWGVLSDQTLARADAVRHRDEFRIGFPVLFDPAGDLAKQLRATHTPQAVVLDPDGKIVYSGAIDDRHADLTRRRPEVRQHFLADALRATLDRRQVDVSRTEPVGCLIEQPSARDATAAVTFNRNIAPILNSHCVACHRPGEVAPFSLQTYADAARRAKQLHIVTSSHIMPPWKPNPHFGQFRGERRLTEAEISRLAAWVDAGAPEGTAADLPPPPRFVDGWQLGRPDLVLQLPEAVDIPSDGPDIYQYFVLPSGLPTDRLMSAIEFRAANPRVVHHATVFVDTSGAARQLDADDDGPGYRRAGGGGFTPAGSLGGWGPGVTPQPLPSGMGRLIPRDADLVLQLHFHPSGKAERDQSAIGIHFAPPETKQVVDEILVANMNLTIPAGAAKFRHRASYVLPVDTVVLDITPHMHQLGREIVATATLPDGRVEPLILIEDWDFNWHDHYVYSRPLRLPRGTRIDVSAVFDNSAANPRNPNFPPRTVRWGEQTSDEMCVCFFQVTTDQPDHLGQLVQHNQQFIGRQQAALPSNSRLR